MIYHGLSYMSTIICLIFQWLGTGKIAGSHGLFMNFQCVKIHQISGGLSVQNAWLAWLAVMSGRWWHFGK